MSLSVHDFLRLMDVHPELFTACLLLLAVLMVNGWTDAPNAIACAVLTGALPFSRAVLLASVCNFFGVVCACSLFPAVAETIYSIAIFSGGPEQTLLALCAALVSIVLFSGSAWLFGLPTSESHGLIAGVTGAAAALEGSLLCIRWESWQKVGWGLALSLVLGLVSGRGFRAMLRPFPPSAALCRKLQIPGAAFSAFLHGAQDGQKFAGIFLLACTLAQGHPHSVTRSVPRWLMLLCAFFMALGTACGGRRIIDTLGRGMSHPTPRDGVACDLAGGFCLALATALGLPVSTTHTKTAALLGVARESGGRYDTGVVRSILGAWLLTFPCCFGLGFLFARLFLALL